MKTPISYYGGKQTLLRHILPLISEHKLYTEAFCGGAAILFAKPAAKCEVINDINSELINFYKVAKTRYPELKTLIDTSLHSREEHAHARYIYEHPSYFTPVQRAWAVWFCAKISFAAKIDGGFGYNLSGTVTRKLRNAKDQFTTELCARLDNVTIECESGTHVIERYDCPEAFHFVDPPYVGTDCGHYKSSFNDADFEDLLKTLASVKGKFMLTMYPHPLLEKAPPRTAGLSTISSARSPLQRYRAGVRRSVSSPTIRPSFKLTDYVHFSAKDIHIQEYR